MTLLLRTAALALLTLLLLAVPAGARTIALGDKAEDVSVAGDRVSWLTQEPGAVTLHTIEPGATTPTTVATLSRHAPGEDAQYELLATDAKSWTVAIRDGRDVPVDPEGYTLLKGDKVVSGAWGSMTTTTRLDCAPPADTNAEDVPGLEIAYAGSHLLLGGASCGALTGLQDLPPGSGAPTQLVGPSKDSSGYGLFAHGAFATYAAGDAVVVRDAAAGKTVTSVPKGSVSRPYALDDDGTLLFGRIIAGPATDETISSVAPGATTPKVLPGLTARPLISGEQDLIAGGGNLLFEPAPQVAKLGLALTPVAGGAARVIGEPGAGSPRSPLAVDATNATFLARACTGVTQLHVVALAAAPTQPIGCPLSVGPKPKLSRSKHTATLTVACPNGCDARLSLSIPPRQKGIGAYLDKHHFNSLGVADVKLTAGGTTTVTVHFAKLAQQFVAKAKGLRPTVDLVTPFDTASEMTGPVRITLPAKI